MYASTLPGLVAINIAGSGDKTLLIYPVTSRDHVFKGLVSYSKSPLCQVCCCSDTAAQIFYVAFQEHVVKGSGDFMEGNSSLYVPTLSILMVIDTVLMDI